MLNIDWNIEFKTNGSRYRLALLAECSITKSVNNLSDTAVITLPESIMNEPLNLENKIRRGSEVIIEFGYDGNLYPEFKGYVRDIVNVDSSIKIMCEDALFLFRKSIGDKQFKQAKITSVAQYLLSEIDPSFGLECDYGIKYDKFTIHKATGLDVLKKLQQETKASIYFDTEKKILHIHPPYKKVGKKVYYSMQKNIESSSLEFKNRYDTKFEIEVEGTDSKGNTYKFSEGVTGGNKIHLNLGTIDPSSMREIAKNELQKYSAPGYEGSFTTWLIPRVEPTDSIRIKDEDYPEKTAWYYCVSVTTTISSSGGVREVKPGIRLSSNG